MKVENLTFTKVEKYLYECNTITENECIVSIFKDNSMPDKPYTCAFSLPNSKRIAFDPTNNIRNIGGISQIYLPEELMNELIREIEKL